jgi:lysophospholipase L1-like esterase
MGQENQRESTYLMRLLFIGDSLIEFYDWGRRFAGHEVFNYGIAGETVEGLYSRVGGVLEKVVNPDLVFIMTGINNVAMDCGDFRETYGRIIDLIRGKSPSSRIIVQSLLPVLVTFVSNGEIRKINRGLKKMAAEKNADYADIHSLFLDSAGNPGPSYLSEDGVHLSDQGYAIWSAEIEEKLKE